MLTTIPLQSTSPPASLLRSAADQSERPTRSPDEAAGRVKRLLVVDDDPSTVKALRSLLRASGYDVITVGTVSEALHRIDASVDGVILDLMLPDGDGAEVIRGIRSAGLKMRVCVTTGVSSPAWLGRVAALGADCILRKPVDVSELLGKL